MPALTHEQLQRARAELVREQAQRVNVYRRLVESRSLSQAQADRQNHDLALALAAVDQLIAQHTGIQGTFF